MTAAERQRRVRAKLAEQNLLPVTVFLDRQTIEYIDSLASTVGTTRSEQMQSMLQTEVLRSQSWTERATDLAVAGASQAEFIASVLDHLGFPPEVRVQVSKLIENALPPDATDDQNAPQ
jgi:hypothetical protein